MRIRAALTVSVRGLALAAFGYFGIVVFTITTMAIAYTFIGLGWLLTPLVVRRMRAYADYRRRLSASWFGVPIASPYREPPEFESGPVGWVRQVVWYLKDGDTWRDVRWLLVDMTAGVALGLLPAGLLLQGLFGIALGAGLWQPIVGATHHTEWYLFVPVTDATSALWAPVVGVALIICGLVFGPRIIGAHTRMSRALLAPSESRALELRVARLTETRHQAVDASAAELRRIERDLHDGAQARLVAMGLELGAVERLLEQDPAKARDLVAAVRRSSADALTELRDLVRGIHPPVLAERGLPDAVRALALRAPVPAEVVVDLPAGRFDAPVEAAAYFAVSELLTNVAKHAADARVWVDLRYEQGMLRVTVTDDGEGGADPARGTGLRGLERRLATFDGVLALKSPRGGPTMVTLELPCVLSSPRTSSC